MDILACPIDKTFPLELVVFSESKVEKIRQKPDRVVCEEYCGLNRKYTRELQLRVDDCLNCMRREVSEGLLICPKCNRWYPIIEEIPHMLPDELRDAREDLAWLEKHRDKAPERVLKEGRPFNLQTSR